MKQLIDKYFKDNYNYLLLVASRICRHNKKHNKEQIDLVTHTYEFFIENQNKEFIKKTLESNEDFIIFTSNTMRKFKRWTNSNYNIINKANYFLIESYSDISDHKAQLIIEIEAEKTNKETKEILIEKEVNGVNAKTSIDCVQIMKIASELSTPDKILFEQSAIHGKSFRQIAREMTERSGVYISHQQPTRRFNEIKLSIKKQLK